MERSVFRVASPKGLWLSLSCLPPLVRTPLACFRKIRTLEACVPIMKRLLLFEDDRSLGATLCERLQRARNERYCAETRQRGITCNGRVIELSNRVIVQPDGEREYPAARDFELLELLVTSSPRVVSRNEILDALWGEDKFLNQRTVDNMIVRLRQLLGDTKSTCIRSVRGIGYQWCGDGEWFGVRRQHRSAT